MNADMFLKVADAIDAHHDAFNLGSWINVDSGHPNNPQHHFDDWDPTKTYEGACGATMCVAGWVNVIESVEDMTKKRQPGQAILAAESLGITHGWENDQDAELVERIHRPGSETSFVKHGSQAHRLFYAFHDSVWLEQADHYGWETEGTADDRWLDADNIVPADAADLLRRIARGEVTL